MRHSHGCMSASAQKGMSAESEDACASAYHLCLQYHLCLPTVFAVGLAVSVLHHVQGNPDVKWRGLGGLT